ncbi:MULTISPECIES: MarR family winged helix-turn-helix transcriptional regulator [unclassified Herbaspirillum]|uniref:MarR family winged helix-turn-helix transcriptional regulator n=1 Tax=unclassified Herbaspirillum TaxID=2624150 RepID=UPI001617B7B7|nr:MULTISPECIES: MarR family transcriptional regulator [unclassified Herbaspirillum]
MQSMATDKTSPTDSFIDQALLLDNQLCFAMYSTSLAMTKLYKKLLKPLDMTYPQYLVMMVLWEKDEVTVSELGTRLFLDSGTLTPLLKRMEVMGLLARSRDVSDERRVLVSLTEQGRDLRHKATSLPSKLMCALPPLEQVGALREALKDVRKGLLVETDDTP